MRLHVAMSKNINVARLLCCYVARLRTAMSKNINVATLLRCYVARLRGYCKQEITASNGGDNCKQRRR